MNIKSERIINYLETVKNTQEIDKKKIEDRKIIKRENDKKREELYGETRDKNLKEFERLGVFDLFRGLIKREIVIQDDDLKKALGGSKMVVNEAIYEFDRNFKKVSLLFDRHRGGRHDESESGHRITISLPFKNGINIHGFQDGDRLTRDRIEFEGKNDEEIRQEIAMAVGGSILELQGYKINRVNLENLKIEE